MGNLYPVAETAAVAIAGVAAFAPVAAAAATAAVAAAADAAVAAVVAADVMCNCECTVMHVEGNGRPNSGYIVIYYVHNMYNVVSLFKRPQQTGIHNICYWCDRSSKQSVCSFAGCCV